MTLDIVDSIYTTPNEFFDLRKTCIISRVNFWSRRCVHDGETLKLLLADNQQLKTSLGQMDAPESNQGFGRVSKQLQSDFDFECAMCPSKSKLPTSRQYCGQCVGGGTDANLAQIKGSYAWFYAKCAHDQAYYAE